MIKFFLFFIVLISMILKISIKQIYDFECGSRSDWIRIGNGVVFYFILGALLFPYLRITFLMIGKFPPHFHTTQIASGRKKCTVIF